MVTKLLEDVIEAITDGCEDKVSRSEPVPASEVVGLQRLMDSEDL